MAQGITAERLFQALRDPMDPFFPLRRHDVYQLELAALLRATGRVVRAVARQAGSRWRLGGGAIDLAALQDELPAGIFAVDRYEAFLDSIFARERLARRFTELDRELHVVADDVDSAERVIFGEHDHRDVSIACAIAASSAIPLFFEPVRIAGRDYFDGGIGRVASVDVAIDHGAERIVDINPVVPIRNTGDIVCIPSSHGGCARLRDNMDPTGSRAAPLA